jgi:hypothetical protein
VDEVRVELASRLGKRPPGTGWYGRLVDEFMYVDQDANPRPLGGEPDSFRR